MTITRKEAVATRASHISAMFECFSNMLSGGRELEDLKFVTSMMREAADEGDKWIEKEIKNDKNGTKRVGRKNNSHT